MPMLGFTFYAAFLGTFLSITFLTYITWKEHHPDLPRSFSQLVAQNRRLVNWFRGASAVCPTLFSVTVYFLIMPNVRYAVALFVVWSTAYASELLLALFPERGTIEKQLHSFFAYNMGLAMIVTAFILFLSLSGGYRVLELGITIGMVTLGLLFTQLDRERFIFYELAFIYSSHASILVAAVALK